METFEIVLIILGLLMLVCALLYSYNRGCLNGLMQAKKIVEQLYNDMDEQKKIYQDILKAYQKLLDEKKEKRLNIN